jgi:FkbM family methyltransferase
MGLAHLNAFEGDARQIENIQKAYAGHCTIYNDFLFDGSLRTLYLATPQSGMSSLLKPREAALNFFNGFTQFGRIESTQTVQTKRLDDIEALTSIDFLKMDIQGAELTVLQNGIQKLNNCLAIQLEVSYVCLYEEQPSFGDVDVWMRSQGFVPHCFLDVKRWSIAPTIFNNNFRVPGNQLLESDILYIKDPLELDRLTNEHIIKLIAISHYCLKSYDLAVHLINHLKQKGLVPSNYQELYLKLINK